MNSRLFLVVDWKDTDDFFLIKKLKAIGVDLSVVNMPDYDLNDRKSKFGQILLYYKYLKQAKRAIWDSKKEDIIICWNFTIGIAVGLISRILHKSRKILALNMIAPSHKGFAGFLQNNIFHYAMNVSSFYLTINSPNYINSNAQRFRIEKRKIFVLIDPVIESADEQGDIQSKGYVFCGGEAQRDWMLYLDLASKMPDIEFIGVARKKFFNKSLSIPKNVIMMFDINHDIFYSLMRGASLVLVPLNSIIPGGLIIIGKAGLMKKPIIATKTPSTANYISDGKTGYLVDLGDNSSFVEKTRELLSNKEKQEIFGSSLRDSLMEKYSASAYTKDLKSILKKCFQYE